MLLSWAYIVVEYMNRRAGEPESGREEGRSEARWAAAACAQQRREVERAALVVIAAWKRSSRRPFAADHKAGLQRLVSFYLPGPSSPCTVDFALNILERFSIFSFRAEKAGDGVMVDDGMMIDDGNRSI